MLSAHRGRVIAIVVAVALLAAAAVLSLRPVGADAQPANCPPEVHLALPTHTNFGGWGNVDLPCNVNPATQLVKVASGGTHLGGEDISYATVNFAGYIDADTIRVRVIGWHADVVTGTAFFRYYSDKDADLFVDVYPKGLPEAS